MEYFNISVSLTFQIQSFRSLLTEQNSNIVNHRDPQPLNKRVIHKHRYDN